MSDSQLTKVQSDVDQTSKEVSDSEKKESAQDGNSSEETAISLHELIEEQEELEAAAEALLGGESERVCTYPEGYKPRQPLYSCLDCTTEGNLAGVCYGCSINCHDGHDLVELYTKRNFCCDCGNSKSKNTCNLFENKKPLNERNTYDHNFKGLYCTCDLPFPCDEIDSDMYQCIICEDWFHLQHLEETPGSVDVNNIEEVVCKECVTKHNFLMLYADNIYNTEAEKADCRKKWLETAAKNVPEVLFFDSYRWRERLCKCTKCLNMYEDSGVSFITDLTDSLNNYVASHSDGEKPKKTMTTVTNQLINAVGRDGAVMILQGYEEMKQRLGNHLKRLAEENRQVKEEDIYAVFQELHTERKRRREMHDGET